MNRDPDEGQHEHRGVRLLHPEAKEALGQIGQRKPGQHEQPRQQVALLQRVRDNVQQHETTDGDQHEPVDEGQHLRPSPGGTGHQRPRAQTGHTGHEQRVIHRRSDMPKDSGIAKPLSSDGSGWRAAVAMQPLPEPAANGDTQQRRHHRVAEKMPQGQNPRGGTPRRQQIPQPPGLGKEFGHHRRPAEGHQHMTAGEPHPPVGQRPLGVRPEQVLKDVR